MSYVVKYVIYACFCRSLVNWFLDRDVYRFRQDRHFNQVRSSSGLFVNPCLQSCLIVDELILTQAISFELTL